MSYQTSIHFDPIALLTIQTEVDNSIKKIESAVTTLVEEQQLPFDIDDALVQLEQCSKILYLIDQPKLSQLTQYCAELVKKIIQDPKNINIQDIKHLSEGTTTLHRYIEFSSLKEVSIPQFLLESLNRLELSLQKPLTQEGAPIKPFLECVTPEFDLEAVQHIEYSNHTHLLYKLCLNQLLNKKSNHINQLGFIAVGLQVANVAQGSASQQYWTLIHQMLAQLEHIHLNAPRLRVLIQLETLISQFLAHPQNFEPKLDDYADLLSLCICQDNALAEQIREKLNLGDDILSDNQLYIFRNQFIAPNQETVKTISELLSTEINTLHKDIEFNYTHFNDERAVEIKHILISFANILELLNLAQTAEPIARSAEKIHSSTVFKDEEFTQTLMNELLSALNDLGLYVRQNTSQYLQYPVKNRAIALDKLDNAYETLTTELKALVELSSSTLINFVKNQDIETLENLSSQFKEMSGAIYFFSDNISAQTAFLNCAQFLENNSTPEISHIECMLDVCASADIMIESIQNHQPVMLNIFDVALHSSHQLKSVA